MKNNKNLNPLNDPEVAEMLTMSPEDQRGAFWMTAFRRTEKILSL